MKFEKSSWGKFGELRSGDWTITLTESDKVTHDCIDLEVSQGGYYGAEATISMYDDELDLFLEKMAEFKAYRDSRK